MGSAWQSGLNDNRPEDEAPRPTHGPHYVTLFDGMSMCSFCGHLWDWDFPQPTDCPVEND